MRKGKEKSLRALTNILELGIGQKQERKKDFSEK